MRSFILLLLTVILNIPSFAQDGTPDFTFNPNDIGHRNGFGPYNTVADPNTYFTKVATQADGKVLCSGQFTQYNGTACINLIRLTADGLYDTTFNTGGAGLEGTVNSIIIQPNGKILIGGELYTYNGTSIQNVIRLNADGSLDSSFTVTVGQGNLNTVHSLALRTDGKLYIAGKFDNITIVRVDANGVTDNTFTCLANAFQGYIYSLGLQSDGKIILGGGFTSFGSTSRNRILRLNTDGSLDTGFDPGTGASDLVKKVIVLPDNKILMMGSFNSYNANYDTDLIARLNPNGVLDTTFTPGFFRISLGTLGVLTSMIVQPDGKILLGGSFNYHGATPIFANATSVINIARLNANGTRDTTLSPIGTDDAIYDVAMQGNTNFIVSGNFETYANVARRRITRSLPNGTNDMTFNTGSGSNSSVLDMKVLTDGKILVAGDFRLYNGVVRNRIARLNSDGTLDQSLNSNLLINSNIYTFKVQSDGKILIGGSFTKVGTASRNLIARLNADFSLDTTFSIGTGFSSNRVTDIAVQTNGKILVVGYFTTFNGVTCNRVARLNANGSLDTTFNVGTGADSLISSVLIQSDGKIILFGNFNNFNGVSRYGIVRLNTNGSLDTTFTTGTGLNGTVKYATELSNGKILLAGTLDTYNSSNVGTMMRLNPDGTRDSSFVMAHNTSVTVEYFAVQPDGKIIMSGTNFISLYSGLKNVAKLSADGAIDGTFNFNTHLGPNGSVFCLGLQTDGKIIIGGNFDTFDTVGRNCVARLNNTAPLSVDDFTDASGDIAVYTENNTLKIDTKDKPLQSVTVYDLNGKLLYENQHVTDSIFVIETLQHNNQVILFKFVDQQGKISGLKTIF